MEHEITYLISAEDLLRLEKALRGAEQYLPTGNIPPTVSEDVRNALRLVEGIRGTEA